METAILVFTKDADMLTLKQQIAALMREYGGENNCQVIENPGEMDYGVVDNVANDCNLQKFDNFLVLEDPAKFTVLDDAMAEEYDGMFRECRAIPEQFRRFTEQDTSTLQNNGVPPVTKPVGNPQQGQNTNDNQKTDQDKQQQPPNPDLKIVAVHPSFPTTGTLQNLMNLYAKAKQLGYEVYKGESNAADEKQMSDEVWGTMTLNPDFKNMSALSEAPKGYIDTRASAFAMGVQNLAATGLVNANTKSVTICVSDYNFGKLKAPALTIQTPQGPVPIQPTLQSYSQAGFGPLTNPNNNQSIAKYLSEIKSLQQKGVKELRKKQWIEGEEEIYNQEKGVITFIDQLVKDTVVFESKINRGPMSAAGIEKEIEKNKGLIRKAFDYVNADFDKTASAVTNQGMGGDNFLGDVTNLAIKAKNAAIKKFDDKKTKDKLEARNLAKKSEDELKLVAVYEYEHYPDLYALLTGKKSGKKGKTAVETQEGGDEQARLRQQGE